jgi:hypothetical protein
MNVPPMSILKFGAGEQAPARSCCHFCQTESANNLASAMSTKQGFRRSRRDGDQGSKGSNAPIKGGGTFASQQTVAENDLGTDSSTARPETTPWELYNERAHIYDKETLKEWEDNLSILLVFVSFAGSVVSMN